MLLCCAALLQQVLRTAGGLAAAGGVAVLRSGSVPTADAADNQQGGTAAAAATAADGVQLGASASGSLAASNDNGGSRETCTSTETVLELRAGGAVVLAVGVAAASGRLTLRLGPGAADESALDQGAFTKQVLLFRFDILKHAACHCLSLCIHLLCWSCEWRCGWHVSTTDVCACHHRGHTYMTVMRPSNIY